MKRLFIFFSLFSLHLLCKAQGGIWTWVKGDSVAGSPGNIGAKGVSNIANYPEGRYQATNWIDLNGNFWVFGGNSGGGEKNDLWKYDPITNIWTWVNGTSSPLVSGVYGTLGVPGPNNVPGARSWGTVSWTDQQGRLWLHGGIGYSSTGISGYLDDQWMYDIPTNQWTWMKGADTITVNPVYGTLHLAATTNTPGSRYECNTAWGKSDGTLWTFGGFINLGVANDMWKFDIATNNWTWMSGPQGTTTTTSYGTFNIEAASNLPPARCTYTRWIDANDNFYIFGGWGGPNQNYNDVWRYNTTNDRWTWIGGDSTANSPGLYNSTCAPGNNSRPSARFENRTAQTNGCSNIFWTYGGFNFNSESLNDLWNFNTQTLNWTLVSGGSRTNVLGNYGTLNVPSSSNIPPSKAGVCLWVDRSGVLWLWSGASNLALSSADMWKFVPDTACLHTALWDIPFSTSLSDSIICSGDSAHFTVLGGHIVSVLPASGSHLIDSTHITFQPSATTSYTVVASDACAVIHTSHLTVIIQAPTVSNRSQTICQGDKLLFNGITISTAGTYADTLQTMAGCDSVILLTVSVSPPPTASFSLYPVGDSIGLGTITAINTSTNADTILWALNQQLISLTSNGVLPINDTGAYCLRLVATSNQGCKDTSKFCFYVFENAFVMPNAFTPNGDGKNDFFHPVIINKNDLTINAFRIYNRWGQLIYNTDNAALGWDGKYKGEAQPSEEYSYYISISLPDRDHPSQMKEINKEGSFSLFR